MGQAGLILGVPDWHQPGLIGAPWGPGGGAAGVYRASCTPAAAADVMGYWEDVRGFAGLADGAVYASGNRIAWAPPLPRTWQDATSDAGSIPVVDGLARAAGMDLGWYLNTNDEGDQTLPDNGGTAAGEQFSGTKWVNVQQGLKNYLTANGQPAASVRHRGGGAAGIAQGWNDIVTEINASRPVMGHFDHFNINPLGGPGSDIYDWGDPTDFDSQTGEPWDPAQGLGHTTTIVGYFDAADAGNPFPGIDAIVVQDNRRYLTFGGVPEADNILSMITLPFMMPGGAALAPWDSNTLINVPGPGGFAVLLLAGAVAMRRRR